jgi:hypothetical protein
VSVNPRTATLVGWAKIVLTLLGLAWVLRLGLPPERLAIAAAIIGGAGFWSGLIVFRGTYGRTWTTPREQTYPKTYPTRQRRAKAPTA